MKKKTIDTLTIRCSGLLQHHHIFDQLKQEMYELVEQSLFLQNSFGKTGMSFKSKDVHYSLSMERSFGKTKSKAMRHPTSY